MAFDSMHMEQHGKSPFYTSVTALHLWCSQTVTLRAINIKKYIALSANFADRAK